MESSFKDQFIVGVTCSIPAPFNEFAVQNKPRVSAAQRDVSGHQTPICAAIPVTDRALLPGSVERSPGPPCAVRGSLAGLAGRAGVTRCRMAPRMPSRIAAGRLVDREIETHFPAFPRSPRPPPPPHTSSRGTNQRYLAAIALSYRSQFDTMSKISAAARRVGFDRAEAGRDAQPRAPPRPVYTVYTPAAVPLSRCATCPPHRPRRRPAAESVLSIYHNKYGNSGSLTRRHSAAPLHVRWAGGCRVTACRGVPRPGLPSPARLTCWPALAP